MENEKTETTCVFGCIFDGDRLYGDCRIPWDKECEMNKREEKKYGEVKEKE